ncbi:MAG: PAC2 family protein [Pirellulales bacterium]|nr:PAC2 family protein [Pirellulales bacterium]
MTNRQDDILQLSHRPSLHEGTLVLAFSGWMDGGDVSTGTVNRLVELTRARPIAEIDPEPFYIYNFPGTMELAALFRPSIEIRNGLVKKLTLPTNIFYCHEAANLLLFVGKEPNMRWRAFGECILQLAHETGIRRMIFVGSYGGTVPHTREPRLYITCSEERLLQGMEQYGVGRSEYRGPGSFTNYLMTQTPSANLEMISLVAEIPSYLQGTNLSSIEAVTRRLAKILKLPLELATLRAASTRWELEISNQIEKDPGLAAQIRKLEQTYDDKLLEQDAS